MKKHRFFLAAIIYLIMIYEVRGQIPGSSKNSFFVEVFGNGGLYSVNYERRFAEIICGRVGFTRFSSDLYGYKTKITAVPVMVSYIPGKNKSHLEIGGGMLVGNDNDDSVSKIIADLTAFAGYRYQSPGNGLLFRIGFTPFFSLDDSANYPDNGFFLSGGLSLGYHF
jgi:hypothetical protein